MDFTIGSTHQSVTILFVDGNGVAKTGQVASNFPPMFYQIADQAPVSISLSDLPSSTWVAGGIAEYGAGRYRLCVPDVLFVALAPSISIYGEASGKSVLCPNVAAVEHCSNIVVEGMAV